MHIKCKRSSDGRAIDHHFLQVMRQRGVKAVGEGQSPESVAKAYGVSVRTVFRWLARAVKDNTPLQFKFEYGLWTLSLIVELFRRQFGKKLALSSVSRIMKILGFTAQKTRYQAWQQDATLVRQWETELYPAIRAEAKAIGATIYFADEAGIRSDYHTGTTWSPKGETPVVAVTGRRFSLNMVSAVSPRGEFRFMLHEGSVNAEVFLEFLKRLLVGAKNPVFLIVDGHPIHKSKKVKDYVASQHGMLKLFFLPPYSPHLNPDELVWAHVKRRVSRQLVENKDQMKRLAMGALRSI